MKRFVLALLLLTPTLLLAGKDKPKPSPADYTINVHVESSLLHDLCAPGCSWVQHLIVRIDGKKYELSDTVTRTDLLRLGDYKARILKDETDSPIEYLRTYELLFPNGWTRKFVVVGEFE